MTVQTSRDRALVIEIAPTTEGVIAMDEVIIRRKGEEVISTSPFGFEQSIRLHSKANTFAFFFAQLKTVISIRKEADPRAGIIELTNGIATR